MNSMTCVTCSQPMEADAQFCSKCGTVRNAATGATSAKRKGMLIAAAIGGLLIVAATVALTQHKTAATNETASSANQTTAAPTSSAATSPTQASAVRSSDEDIARYSAYVASVVAISRQQAQAEEQFRKAMREHGNDGLEAARPFMRSYFDDIATLKKEIAAVAIPSLTNSNAVKSANDAIKASEHFGQYQETHLRIIMARLKPEGGQIMSQSDFDNAVRDTTKGEEDAIKSIVSNLLDGYIALGIDPQKLDPDTLQLKSGNK